VAKAFFDTNVLLYLLSADATKADTAEAIVAEGGVISVQVLNEFAAVVRRKLGLPLPDIREALGIVREVCEVVPLTEGIHDSGLAICGRYKLGLYDSMIVAAALEAGATRLISEDFQHGQTIKGIKIVNPFTKH